MSSAPINTTPPAAGSPALHSRQTNSTSTGGVTTKFNPFDEDSYGAGLATIESVPAKNIAYSAAAGTFTPTVKGTYSVGVAFATQASAAGNTQVRYSIEVNSVERWGGTAIVNSSVDPVFYTPPIIVAVEAGEAIECFIDGLAALGVQSVAGTTMTIHHIAP